MMADKKELSPSIAQGGSTKRNTESLTHLTESQGKSKNEIGTYLPQRLL